MKYWQNWQSGPAQLKGGGPQYWGGGPSTLKGGGSPYGYNLGGNWGSYEGNLESPDIPPANMGIDPSELIAPTGGGWHDSSGYTPYPAGGYTPPPTGGIPLEQPPGVNMPPNEQPPPKWMKWMPPIVKAGYGGFRAGQRAFEMFRNLQNRFGGGGHSGSGGLFPNLPAGYSPFGGLPPGFTETNRFGGGAPIFTPPGFTGPNWTPGGSIFGGRGLPIVVGGGNLGATFGGGGGPTNLYNRFGPTGQGPHGMLNAFVNKGGWGAGGGPRMNPRKD